MVIVHLNNAFYKSLNQLVIRLFPTSGKASGLCQSGCWIRRLESPSGHATHLVSGMVTFYRDSMKHKNFKVETPVPFAEAYPTFSSFTRPGQAYWYFYWRGKVLEGKYPETDYGYIRLLIFELMNYGLIPDPKRSVAH